MSRVYFLAVALFLSGCSSLFVEQPKSPWESSKQQSRQCLKDISDDRELKVIARKVTLESTYDRDTYFELQAIKDLPNSNEKPAIKKWAAKLDHCYKLKSESYAFEPSNVAVWSAASDSEQLSLVVELSKGNLSYGEFASRRLEIDTRYRGQIIRAISADYKKPTDAPQQKNGPPAKTPAGANSSCGWEGNQWVCRSL